MEFRTWPPLLVVDVEGNGAAPLPDLVEVATVPVAEGRADSDRSRIWLIRPQRPITRFATSVHGITNEAVADAKPWSELGPQIQAELDGVWIAAHNAASMWCSAGPQAPPRRQVLARPAAGEAALTRLTGSSSPCSCWSLPFFR